VLHGHRIGLLLLCLLPQQILGWNSEMRYRRFISTSRSYERRRFGFDRCSVIGRTTRQKSRTSLGVVHTCLILWCTNGGRDDGMKSNFCLVIVFGFLLKVLLAVIWIEFESGERVFLWTAEGSLLESILLLLLFLPRALVSAHAFGFSRDS